MQDNFDAAGSASEAGADCVRVSVVIPAYNAAAFLDATLRSVINQSAAPAEIIVVDDGSTDDTAAIAGAFGARVIPTALPRSGPAAARNTGTHAASGEYIAYLDADDVWAPQKLACQLQALAAFGRPAFSFTDYRLFDENGVTRHAELLRYAAFRQTAKKIVGSSNMLIAADASRPALTDSYFPPSAVLVRRVDVLAAGGFDETLRMAEDYDFYLRLLRLVPGVAVMQPLFFYRRHAGQATADAIQGKAGFFDVAARVAAAPGRYPSADVRYIARAEYARRYQLGLAQARLAHFDDAVESFERSLKCRPTARAAFGLCGSMLARSKLGRTVFSTVRTIWKRRPRKRSPVTG